MDSLNAESKRGIKWTSNTRTNEECQESLTKWFLAFNLHSCIKKQHIDMLLWYLILNRIYGILTLTMKRTVTEDLLV